MSAPVPLRRRDGSAEFDCIECGARVIRFAMRPGEPALCSICISLPGWERDEELRRLFRGEPP